MQLYTPNDPQWPSPGEITLGIRPDAPHEEWEQKLAHLRHAWLEIIGPMPEEPSLQNEIISETNEGDHIRYLLRYQTEPGVYGEAFLLYPSDLKEKNPAAVVFHATSPAHFYQPAGLADSPTRHLGLHLVRRGYIVLCPRNFIYAYEDQPGKGVSGTEAAAAEQWRHSVEELHRRHPNLTGIGKMLSDGKRAVSYLLTLAEIDPARIAVAGHSLGAKQALYMAAFDQRIAAAVSSEGGLGLSQSNWEAPWYLGQRARSIAPHDHHELLAIAAPKAFLLIGGGNADGQASWPWITAAAPAYKSQNAPRRLAFLLHHAGHDIPDNIRQHALQWLDNTLTP